ncbi:hypothetical protein CNMCM8927_000946 [Aspergillus lentulus]|uniref:Uncharacterized protein n=1 Tax=Aspergillus lentulus TaxID=293939 RepID=A0AAN5YJP6_ASPLE|nr:hypothetical protein CNMCM8927_000946 [Aspergillus lentulus]
MSATTVSTSDISLQPLTTPFIPPPGCGNQYSTTDYLLYSKHSYHLSVSKELPSCQPSGWGVSQSSRFDYSPAVCPAGWTAYSIGGTVSSASPMTAATRSVTTAFCCSKRFTLSTLYGLPIPGTSLPACFQSVSATTALLPRQTIPSPVPTVRMHEAWHITWASTDVPTLHPPPPDIGACTALALSSWVPGAAVEGGLSLGAVYVLVVGKRSVERRGWSLPISKLLWIREDVEALPKRLRCQEFWWPEKS